MIDLKYLQEFSKKNPDETISLSDLKEFNNEIKYILKTYKRESVKSQEKCEKYQKIFDSYQELRKQLAKISKPKECLDKINEICKTHISEDTNYILEYKNLYQILDYMRQNDMMAIDIKTDFIINGMVSILNDAPEETREEKIEYIYTHYFAITNSGQILYPTIYGIEEKQIKTVIDNFLYYYQNYIKPFAIEEKNRLSKFDFSLMDLSETEIEEYADYLETVGDITGYQTVARAFNFYPMSNSNNDLSIVAAIPNCNPEFAQNIIYLKALQNLTKVFKNFPSDMQFEKYPDLRNCILKRLVSLKMITEGRYEVIKHSQHASYYYIHPKKEYAQEPFFARDGNLTALQYLKLMTELQFPEEILTYLKNFIDKQKEKNPKNIDETQEIIDIINNMTAQCESGRINISKNIRTLR